MPGELQQPVPLRVTLLRPRRGFTVLPFTYTDTQILTAHETPLLAVAGPRIWPGQSSSEHKRTKAPAQPSQASVDNVLWIAPGSRGDAEMGRKRQKP